MASDPIIAKIEGLDDLRAALQSVVPKLRLRALRNALAAGARIVQRAARDRAPVISASALAVRKGYRKPGTVRQAISVRTSKQAKAAGDVGVFVNVRPAKGARFRTRNSRLLGLKIRQRVQVAASQRGARNPNDPYYWRFIEFGTRTGTRAGRFLRQATDRLPQALAAFTRAIGPQIAKLNRPKAPAP